MINVKLKNIELGTPSDGDICFNPETGKYSLWYKYKYYAIPEEAIELSEQIKGKNSRKVLYHKDDSGIWNFYFSDGYSCSCGCNVYHYEDNGSCIYAICNACKECLGTLKNEYRNEYLDKGIWK